MTNISDISGCHVESSLADWWFKHNIWHGKKNILSSYMLSHCPPFGIPVPLFPKRIPFRDVWSLASGSSHLLPSWLTVEPQCCSVPIQAVHLLRKTHRLNGLIHLIDLFDGQIHSNSGSKWICYCETCPHLEMVDAHHLLFWKAIGFGPSHSTSQGSAEFHIFILESIRIRHVQSWKSCHKRYSTYSTMNNGGIASKSDDFQLDFAWFLLENLSKKTHNWTTGPRAIRAASNTATRFDWLSPRRTCGGCDMIFCHSQTWVFPTMVRISVRNQELLLTSINHY